MNQNVNLIAQQAVRKVKNRRIRRRVVALLSTVVVLTTMNQTKLLADALDHLPDCGYEEHLHDGSCYDAAGELTCGLPEHVHTDACFQTRPVVSAPETEIVTTMFEPEAEEIDAFDFPCEDAPQADVMRLEASEASEGEVSEAQPSYRLGGQDITFLSDILKAVGLDIGPIYEVAQVLDDEHPELMLEIAEIYGDWSIRPLCDFDRAELAITTNDNIYIVALLDGVAYLPEAVETGAPEPAASVAEESAITASGDPTAGPAPTAASASEEENSAAEAIHDIEEEKVQETTPSEKIEEERLPEEDEADVTNPEDAEPAQGEAAEEDAEPAQSEDGEVAEEDTEADEAKSEEAEQTDAEPDESHSEETEQEDAESAGENEETSETVEDDDAAIHYEARFSLSEMELPLSLRALMDAAAQADDAGIVDTETADYGEIDAWDLDYNEAHLDVQRMEEDYFIAPLDSFETERLFVSTGAVEFTIILEGEAETEGSEETETEGAVVRASYDLSEVELPMNLMEVIPELLPEIRSDEAFPEWILEYDENLLTVDENRCVMPIAFFSETTLAVTVGEVRCELTLLNYIEKETKPALDLGLAVVTPADETQAFDAEATGSAELLEGVEAEAARAAVESLQAEDVEETEEEIVEAEPAATAQGIVTTETRTEYRAFSITLENVDESEYEDGFNITVNLNEALTEGDVQLYHILDDASAEEIPVENVTEAGFSFTSETLDTFVVAYTVDFRFGQFEYSLRGGEGMLLSELFEALELDADAAEAETVIFSDAALLSVEKLDGDWRLNSLAPFDTEELLTVDMANGDHFEIAVTDDQETVTWASPYDLAGNAYSWVKGAELLVENASGDMVAPTSGMEIPEYAAFSIRIPFEVPNAGNNVGFNGLMSGDKIVYTIPSWVRKLDVESGTLTVGDKNAGEWKIEDNQVVITLNDDFIRDNPYGLSGSIKLSGSMEATTTTETGTEKVIDFLGTTVNTVVKKRTGGVLNIDIQKVFKGETNGKSGANCGEISSAKYELTVFAGDLTGNSQRNNGDLEEIVIDDFFTVKEKYAFKNEANFNQNDALKQFITYKNISAKIYDHNGAEVTDRRVVVVDDSATDAAAQFKVMNADGTAFSVLHPDEKVVITYDAEISEEMYEHDPRGPWREETDQQDEFGWRTVVNELDGSSGSAKNTAPIEGATNQNRSWVERQAKNGASVRTQSLSEPKQATTKNADGTNKAPLSFGKTWLWKNGDPKTNYTSDYQVSVNEAPIMNITGWTFSDPIGNGQNGQAIISDVRVTRDGADYETISLSALQQAGGVSSGNAAGSTTDGIVYVFPDNANYRFFYTARYKNPTGENEIKCKNSATLTEKDGDGDTYGVYETHTVRGATVTKRLDYMDVGEGLIRWQTTIDEGIDVADGSVYKDFLGWIRKPKDDDHVESTLNSTDKDHTVDLSRMKLEITHGKNEEVIPAADYTVTAMTKEEIGTSRLVNDQPDGVANWNVPYGFKITFNKAYTGPILVHYSTVADFANVVWEEEFTNKCTYQKEPPTDEQPNGSFIFQDTASASYLQQGTLNKVAESVGDEDVPVIKWHLTVNEAKYNASKLKVVDTIPEGLEFDLRRDLQVRWVENGAGASPSEREDWYEAYTGDRDAPFDSWPTKTATNADNDYFTATYDSDTRKLEIVLKDIACKKVEFNVYTQPTLAQLKDGVSHEYENTAEVWTASNTQTNVKLQTASAKSSISYTFAGKDVVYNTETAPNAHYKIEVNKGGIDLNPKGDRFTVTDSAVEGSTLRFKVPETLKVSKKDGTRLTLNEDPYSEIKANEVRLTAIGDSSFSLDVPDNTPLVIEYDAYVPGVIGEDVDLSNSVTLTAENEEIFTRTLTKNTPVQRSRVTVDVANRIMIRKGSTGENAVLLDGAVFAIYDVTDSEGYSTDGLTPKGTITTGQKKANGEYEVGFGLASTYMSTTQITLENFHIYKLVETKAPEGYKTPTGEDAVAGMFVFVTEEPPTDTTQEAYLSQIQGYRSAGIQVINQNYTEFAFYKSNEPDLTRITVTKQWLDKDGALRTTYEEDKGTITFALMRHIDGQEDEQVGEKHTLTYDNDWPTETIEDLPKIENGKAITYYVVEDAPSVPEGAVRVDVSYRVGENGVATAEPSKATTVSTADSSTITIINQDIVAYALPSTGGMGTVPFTLGGILLVLGAAILLMLRASGKND